MINMKVNCNIINIAKLEISFSRWFSEIPSQGQVLNFLSKDKKTVDTYVVQRVERNFVENEEEGEGEVEVALFCLFSRTPATEKGFIGLTGYLDEN